MNGQMKPDMSGMPYYEQSLLRSSREAAALPLRMARLDCCSLIDDTPISDIRGMPRERHVKTGRDSRQKKSKKKAKKQARKCKRK